MKLENSASANSIHSKVAQMVKNGSINKKELSLTLLELTRKYSMFIKKDNEYIRYAEDLELIKFLILSSADVNVKCEKFGNTPLMYMCRMTSFEKELEIIELMLEHGADVNQCDKYGDNAILELLSYRLPLDNNIRNLHNKKLRLLIKYCANIEVVAHDKTNPISRAVILDNYQALLTLIEAGANVNFKINDTITLVQISAINNNFVIAKELINVCAEVHSTDLLYLSGNGIFDIEFWKLLINAGAKVLAPDENSNAFITAAKNGQNEIVRYLKNILEIPKVTLKVAASEAFKEKHFFTALICI